MVSLLLLIALEGIFGFVQIKKTKKLLACANHASTHQPLRRLRVTRVTNASGFDGTSATLFDLSRHPLPPGGCMYGGSAGLPGNGFSFLFLFLLFLPGIACWPCKKSYRPFNIFFFGFSPFSLICKKILFTLIISIRFYFLFHLCSFYF
jgi:hypothetical protein